MEEVSLSFQEAYHRRHWSNQYASPKVTLVRHLGMRLPYRLGGQKPRPYLAPPAYSPQQLFCLRRSLAWLKCKQFKPVGEGYLDFDYDSRPKSA